jgi:hypothetical protein
VDDQRRPGTRHITSQGQLMFISTVNGSNLTLTGRANIADDGYETGGILQPLVELEYDMLQRRSAKRSISTRRANFSSHRSGIPTTP